MSARWDRVAPWLLAAAAFALLAATAGAPMPVGVFYDDGIYFDLARALAKDHLRGGRATFLACGQEDCGERAIVVADASTPYRLLVEVLFTLGQSEYGKYHLDVQSGRKK